MPDTSSGTAAGDGRRSLGLALAVIAADRHPRGKVRAGELNSWRP